MSHAPVDSWADEHIIGFCTDAPQQDIADEANIGFCTGAPQQDIADERDMDRPSSALADKRGLAKVVNFEQCPQPNIADERDRGASLFGLIRKVADAPQEGRSVEFAQEEGSGRESSSDNESHEGDTAASSTENDIANGDLTAVAARRKEEAQPKRKVAGEVHHPKPSAYRNTKAEVGNVGLMIGNWGERSKKNKLSRQGSARSSSYGEPGTDPSDIRRDDRRRDYARTAAAACQRQTVAADWTCSCRQCGGARLVRALCHDRPGCKVARSHGSVQEQLQRHRNPLL